MNKYKSVICPYCAHEAIAKKFILSMHKRKYIFKCPLCSNRVREELLFTTMNAVDWGFWMNLCVRTFRSPHNRFVERINYELLFNNLTKLKAKYAFLEGYHYIRDHNIPEIEYYNLLKKLEKDKKLLPEKKKIITLHEFMPKV